MDIGSPGDGCSQKGARAEQMHLPHTDQIERTLKEECGVFGIFGHEEAAQITDLSVAALKSRLHRARAFLRKELNEELGK